MAQTRAVLSAAAAACALTCCSASPQPILYRTSPAIHPLVGYWAGTFNQKVRVGSGSKVITRRLTDYLLVADDGTFTDSYQLILPIGQERIPELFTMNGYGKVEWLGGNRYRFERGSKFVPGRLIAFWNFTARLSVVRMKLFTNDKFVQVFHR